MPNYRYEHQGEGCSLGKSFDFPQSMREDAFALCPECGGSVDRIVCPTSISTPRGDTELRDKGFAKLVKRDKGVYENVTALNGESRYWDANKPGTMPDIKRRISD